MLGPTVPLYHFFFLERGTEVVGIPSFIGRDWNGDIPVEDVGSDVAYFTHGINLFHEAASHDAIHLSSLGLCRAQHLIKSLAISLADGSLGVGLSEQTWRINQPLS